MRIGLFGVIALGLLTAACGSNTTQRAASGGLTGGAVGAVVGGPVGALAGAAIGAAGGWAMPEGADTLALNAIGKEKRVASGTLNNAGLGPTATSGSSQSREVKQAQAELRREGFYRGPVDGILGPETRQALAAYQAREGLQQTARLDRETMERMNLAAGSSQAARSSSMETSGSSTPPADQGAANANSGANPGATSTSTDSCSGNQGASDTNC